MVIASINVQSEVNNLCLNLKNVINLCSITSAPTKQPLQIHDKHLSPFLSNLLPGLAPSGLVFYYLHWHQVASSFTTCTGIKWLRVLLPGLASSGFMFYYLDWLQVVTVLLPGLFPSRLVFFYVDWHQVASCFTAWIGSKWPRILLPGLALSGPVFYYLDCF